MIYETPTVADLGVVIEAGRGDQVEKRQQPQERQEQADPAGRSGRWLACREQRPDASYRLYCFEY